MSRNTFNRADTLLGICEALGQDLGFNPLYLRVALAVGLFWSFEGVIAAYLALGVVVVVARLVAPDRTADTIVAPAAVEAANDQAGVLAEAA